jgi:Ca2+-binding RTX toxin-like protein
VVGVRKLVLLASIVLAVLLAAGVAFAATVNCVEGEDFCVGTNKDDTLNGSEVTDRIYGLGGIDQLFGNGGDDKLLGGKGTDTIKGGEGADTASGQTQGADKIYGEGGDDDLSDDSWVCRDRCIDDKNLLDGGDGEDYLYGDNKLYGGPGNDEVHGAYAFQGNRLIDGGSGTDTISSAGKATDTIYAQDGERDVISCGPKTDTVYYDGGIDSVNPVSCERRFTQPPP